MNKEKNNKSEDILNSLEGVKRSQVPDFFYTRLLAKMQNSADGSNKKIWIFRPAYAAVILLLIVAVNVIVFLRSKDETTTMADDSQTLQQTIATEYSLADNNSIYDLNTDK